MPLLTPHGKHLSIQNLLAISTLMSPFHHHDRTLPIIQAGGGHAASEIPEHQFYLSNAIQDHLKTVYQQHCGKEQTLSREALVDFLRDTQVQPIEVPTEPATYGFEEFLKFLWSNQALDGMRAAAPKDLSKPISNYFISSSHNTYLSGNQLSSKSSTDAYKNVLLRGCRCIEIDVWNGEAAVTESAPGTSPPHRESTGLSLLEKVASKVENKVEKAERKLDYAVELIEEKAGFADKAGSESSKERVQAAMAERETRERKALDLERNTSHATVGSKSDYIPTVTQKVTRKATPKIIPSPKGKGEPAATAPVSTPAAKGKVESAATVVPVSTSAAKGKVEPAATVAPVSTPAAKGAVEPATTVAPVSTPAAEGKSDKPTAAAPISTSVAEGKADKATTAVPASIEPAKPVAIQTEGQAKPTSAATTTPVATATAKGEGAQETPTASTSIATTNSTAKGEKDQDIVPAPISTPTPQEKGDQITKSPPTSTATATPITKAKEDHGSLQLAESNSLQKIPSITSTDPHEDFVPPELQRAVAINPRTSTDSLAFHSRPSSRHSVSSIASTRPEPRVLHGWTLTSEISFRDVCRTVRETAFQTTDLPIIVSLEVHADVEQQEIMVDIMKEEWAGYLVDQPYDQCDPERNIPRLGDLRNKILVKVKKAAQKEPTELKNSSTNKSLAPLSTVDTKSSEQSGSEDERAGKKKKAKSKICDSLSQLGIYTRSTHFVSFEEPEAKHPPHIFSVAEDKILELHETRQNDLFSHNRNFFMRAYPAGRRFDSSNLDPSVFWRKGVQMVALNWQTWDEAMMLNEGMFAGENGWVLKPQGYRSLDNIANQVDAINHITLDLKIKIYAAQHLPLPPNEDKISGFHPYVKCELHVEKAEERLGLPIEGGGKSKEGAHKQQSQTRKGVEPDWNGEQMVFYGIPDVVEELSFVRFKIQDDELYKDHLAAWACIRLDRLEQGYRFIRLFDAKGAATAGMLLVKVEKISRK